MTDLKINVTVLQVTAVFTCSHRTQGFRPRVYVPHSWYTTHTTYWPTPNSNSQECAPNTTGTYSTGSCITDLSTSAVSHRKPASAWTSSYSCHYQVSDTRNICSTYKQL